MTPRILLGVLAICSMDFSSSVAQLNSWERTGWPVKDGRYCYDITIDVFGSLWAITYVPRGQYHGVFRSDDNGDTWKALDFPDSNLTSVTANSLGHVFVGSYSGGIYRSIDRGTTWLQTGPPGIRVTRIVCDSAKGVYALSNPRWGTNVQLDSSLYVSTDGGSTWTPERWSIRYYAYPWEVVGLIAGSAGLLYTGGDGIFRSTDSGKNWEDISPPHAVSVTRLSRLWPGCIIALGDSLYRTTNDGVTWETAAMMGLPKNFRRCLIADTRGGLYLGLDNGGGVFYSSDRGDNWFDYNINLASRDIFAFTLNSSRRLYAATYEDGVYRTTAPVTSVASGGEAFPAATNLRQNYPNPFNGISNFGFSILDLSWVTLKVYDLLGREVVALVDESKPAGEYNVRFDGSGLASGVYLYRLTAGSFTAVKKMVLVR